MKRSPRVIGQWLYGAFLILIERPIMFVIFAPYYAAEERRIAVAAYKKFGSQSVINRLKEIEKQVGL